MAIAPRLEKVAFLKNAVVTSKNKIECKLGLFEDDLLILCSNASACLLNAEVLDGEIRYSGRAIFNAVCSDGNDLKKFESGVEFSFKCNSGVASKNQALNLAKVEVIEVDTIKQNGVLLANATIVFSAEVCYEEELEQLSCKNADFLTKKQTAEKCDLICRAEKTFTLQEDFDVTYKVKDVICHNEKVILSTAQCGIGCVLLDGEVELSMALKTDAEKSEVFFEKRRIPFRFELDCNDAMPTQFAMAILSASNCGVKIYVDENKGKSTVNASIEILAKACVYETSAYEYCVDAYSTTSNLKLENRQVTLENIIGSDCFEQKIVSDLAYYDENALLVCVLNDKIENIETSFKNGEILVKGVTSVTFLLEIDGKLTAQTSLIPFETKTGVNCNAVKNAYVTIYGVEVQKADGKFTCTFTLKICYSLIGSKTVKLLSNVEEGEKKAQNDSAISVYIASKGEDLWDVCKALNTSEEVILSSNGDLTFPLEKEERILIYRELSGLEE